MTKKTENLEPLKRYQRFKKSRGVRRKKKTLIDELNSLGLLDPNHKVEEGDKYILAVVKEVDNGKSSATAISKKSSDFERIFPTLLPEAQELAQEFKDVFPDQLPKELPPVRGIEHRIDLIDGAKPPKSSIYRMTEMELKELKSQLDDLLKNGFIKPSLSAFGSPILFVRKKDGSMRLVVDYRKLNAITIKNSFGLPRADEQLSSIKGAQWFTKLDLHSGYNQVRVREFDEEKAAFKCRFNHYEFLVIPFWPL